MPKKKKAVSKTNLPSKAPIGYADILDSIIQKIQSAHGRAMSAVNKELIEVYRDIGKTIHKQQESGEWGDAIVKTFAADLQKRFPGMRGFSYRNIYTMRDLYLSYKDSEKLQTLSAQISWSHNVAILSKCKDPLEKEFYMKMSKRNGWTYRVLIHQIELGTYENTLLSQSNFKKSLIAVELKVSEFIPEYIGKMQFYLSVLDDTVRIKGENPSIGIILCKSKKRTVVEYALKDANKPINVSSYHLVKKLPKELKDELPSPEQIAMLLDSIE